MFGLGRHNSQSRFCVTDKGRTEMQKDFSVGGDASRIMLELEAAGEPLSMDELGTRTGIDRKRLGSLLPKMAKKHLIGAPKESDSDADE